MIKVPYAGRVYDHREKELAHKAIDEFFLTSGKYTAQFEKGLCDFLGVKHCAFVNSGSSANLLAFMALTQPELGDRRILRGDEVITTACCFPTTISPIIQYGAKPVFVDITIPEYNIDVTQLEKARSRRTKAVMLAHTLGNPFNVKAVKEFCNKYGYWLISDCCDALGARYGGADISTCSDISTLSFYPAHHMTTGEGGAVCTNNTSLYKLILSLRDWGRDCICPSGYDNACGKRFSHIFDGLPSGYDHKYVYSHFGYNLKATDIQAAIGCAQLEKLADFIKARRSNWKFYKDHISNKYFILPEAEQDGWTRGIPSWFGFVLTIKPDAPFTREQFTSYLEKAGIQTRTLFAGNITKHPCFEDKSIKHRTIGKLPNTDIVLKNTFWIGVYPGLTKEQKDYVISTISKGLDQMPKDPLGSSYPV